jgi:hypothetical protein
MGNMPVYAYHQLCLATNAVSKQQAACITNNNDSMQIKIAMNKALEILTQEKQRLETKFPGINNIVNSWE